MFILRAHYCSTQSEDAEHGESANVLQLWHDLIRAAGGRKKKRERVWERESEREDHHKSQNRTLIWSGNHGRSPFISSKHTTSSSSPSSAILIHSKDHVYPERRTSFTLQEEKKSWMQHRDTNSTAGNSFLHLFSQRKIFTRKHYI